MQIRHNLIQAKNFAQLQNSRSRKTCYSIFARTNPISISTNCDSGKYARTPCTGSIAVPLQGLKHSFLSISQDYIRLNLGFRSRPHLFFFFLPTFSLFLHEYPKALAIRIYIQFQKLSIPYRSALQSTAYIPIRLVCSMVKAIEASEENSIHVSQSFAIFFAPKHFFTVSPLSIQSL